MVKLHFGDNRAAVRFLQAALNKRSRHRGLPLVAEDGILGAQTLAAVQRVGRALGALESTLAKARKNKSVSIGLQRMIRWPGARTPAQLSRARSRQTQTAAESVVIRRSDWTSRSPSAWPKHSIVRAVLHHTAFISNHIKSPVMERAHMRTILRWHIMRGFSDIGYGTVTFASGRTYEGRPLDVIGAGVAGHNTGSAHHCLAGNFERETPTAAALVGLKRAMVELGTWDKPRFGHFELQANACPGKNMRSRVRNFG